MSISTILSRFLLKQDDATRISLINHHALWGYTFKNWTVQLPEIKDQAKATYLKQWLQNQTYLKLLDELLPKLLDIDSSLMILKGIHHLDDLYIDDIAVRFMSDIDLLIDKEKLPSILRMMEEEGFSKNGSLKWYGDLHKIELFKTIDDVQITIELHSKLFFHLDSIELNPVARQGGGWVLSLEERLVYLSAHYAFQHTLLKLYWLIDIALLVQKNRNLDFGKCEEIARKWQVYHSFCYVMGILSDHFEMNLPIQRGRFQFLINESSLWNMSQKSLRYLILKHLFKDKWMTSFKYNLLWLKRYQVDKES